MSVNRFTNVLSILCRQCCCLHLAYDLDKDNIGNSKFVENKSVKCCLPYKNSDVKNIELDKKATCESVCIDGEHGKTVIDKPVIGKCETSNVISHDEPINIYTKTQDEDKVKHCDTDVKTVENESEDEWLYLQT